MSAGIEWKYTFKFDVSEVSGGEANEVNKLEDVEVELRILLRQCFD